MVPCGLREATASVPCRGGRLEMRGGHGDAGRRRDTEGCRQAAVGRDMRREGAVLSAVPWAGPFAVAFRVTLMRYN